MSLSIDGPKTRYKNRPADWIIKVGNPSDVPMGNVVVRDKLPRELQFISASQGGQLTAGEVVWNIGNLNAREERTLQITAQALELTDAAVQNVTATAEPGLRKDAQAALKVFGLPALRTEIVEQGNPAQVGNKVTYNLKITNPGTLEANDITVTARIPAEMKFTSCHAQPEQRGRSSRHFPEDCKTRTESSRGIHDRSGSHPARRRAFPHGSHQPDVGSRPNCRGASHAHLQSGAAAGRTRPGAAATGPAGAAAARAVIEISLYISANRRARCER